MAGHHCCNGTSRADRLACRSRLRARRTGEFRAPASRSILGPIAGERLAAASLEGARSGTRIDGVRRRRRRSRPVRPEHGDTPQAARRGGRTRAERVRDREGLRGGCAHPLRRRARAALAERALPRLEGARRAAQHSGEGGPLPAALRDRLAPAAHAAADAQRGQLHHQPRQLLPLAGGTGRGHGRGDLPRLRRRRGALRRRRRRPGRRHRRHGHRQGRPAEGHLHAGRGAAGAADGVLRGLPRLAHQDAVRALRSPRGRGPADLWHRHQGAVGDRAREAQPRARHPHRRLADGREDLRRLLPLPPGGQPGRRRLRHRAGLREPLPLALRRVPALQDAPRHPPLLRGRPARGLWRASSTCPRSRARTRP